ncbi:MAG: chorismate lyase [Proteobacteria bacterium]|nr:chorismate lyase [Pseudomonadota bacterium]
MKIRWQSKQCLKIHAIDKRLRSFLFQTGSLTRYIQQSSKAAIQVELETETWGFPMRDEASLLGIRTAEYAFIRESWLKSSNKRIVYARTIIPGKTLKGKTRKLANIGNKPLGEILFADKTTHRSSIRYGKVMPNCDLYELIKDNVNEKEEIWGRQSLFYIQYKPLLISEVFLPAILTCIK